jgi:nitroimidazol reductase NimA-like FMN-containing flavoprotein (pyridoxamine 5'-phosphate oxidase superfamily)
MTVAIHDLPRERCLELLARSVMGRLAYCSASGPRIYPLNFALHGETLVFRTAAHTTLGTEIDGREAAFEIDEIDGVAGRGWSVVVSGRAEVVSDPDEMVDLRRVAGPQPWAPGVRSLYVRIPISRISGRAIGEV